KPAAGNKLQSDSPSARKYRGLLEQRHTATVGKAKGARKLYDYTEGFNGFAAVMSADAAAALRRTPAVLAGPKNQMRNSTTVGPPHFLGLDKKGGVWSRLGGAKNAGKDIVIGDIDSGLWPENPSFAPLPKAKTLSDWHGTCQTGEQWDASDCTNK